MTWYGKVRSVVYNPQNRFTLRVELPDISRKLKHHRPHSVVTTPTVNKSTVAIKTKNQHKVSARPKSAVIANKAKVEVTAELSVCKK